MQSTFSSPVEYQRTVYNPFNYVLMPPPIQHFAECSRSYFSSCVNFAAVSALRDEHRGFFVFDCAENIRAHRKLSSSGDPFGGVAATIMDVGRGAGGRGHPWILGILAKSGCFLNFHWEIANFTTFPPWKNPSDTHGHNVAAPWVN